MTEPGDPSPGADRPGTRERLRSLAVDTSPLRKYPAFRRLFIGQTVSTFGSELAAVAAPFQLYDLTHSTLQVGLLSLCELAPLLTLTIAGGAIADAFDRRTLLFRTEAMLAVVAALFAVNAALPHPRVWAIYVLVTLTMSIFSLGVAGMSSLIPRLVEQDDLVPANALESVYGSTTSVAGPAVAGVLIAAVGLPLAYALDSITFAASLWSIWRLPPLPPAHDADRPSLRSIAEGFRYVRAKKVVLGMFIVDSSAMVFGMPRALFPAMAVSRFDGGAGVLGLLYAAPYAGALVSSLLSGWIARVRRQGLYVAVAAVVLGPRDRRLRVRREPLGRAGPARAWPAPPTTSAPSSAAPSSGRSPRSRFADASPGSSSRRSPRHLRSATSRPACSPRSRVSASRSSRAACCASSPPR